MTTGDDRGLRILHVVHGLPRGGLENGVVNLLNGLPRGQFEQAVCCLDRRGEMADRIQSDVPLWTLNRGRHDLRAPFRLAGIIREWRPHVVHCRNWSSWMDAVLGRLLARGDSRLVWSFHGFIDADRLPARRRWASRALAGITDELFAVCRDAAQRYADRAGIDPRRFEVIYNGVDLERFRPAEDRAALRRSLGMDEQRRVLLTVASLIPVKGHADLLRALAMLGRLGVELPEVWLVGEGPLRPELESLVADLRLGPHVHMPGHSDQVPGFLSASDLFVLPSRLEGMSNAILEAMAAGLPVVARAVGGNPELVVDGVTGALCRPNEVAAMAEAIGRLLLDPALGIRMGQAGRKRAERVFSIQTMLDGYADYYRRVCVRA